MSSEKIREQVNQRHWQLFEIRLKNSLSIEMKKDNYTQMNNYRIVNRFKSNDLSQLPIEPKQRWLQFSSQLTKNSNETNRLMSIFHRVWIKNWNTIENKLTSNENNCFKYILLNDHEKKILTSILHRTI